MNNTCNVIVTEVTTLKELQNLAKIISQDTLGTADVLGIGEWLLFKAKLFLVKNKNKILGYCAVIIPSRNEELPILLNAIYILPKYRNSGFGSILMAEVCKYLDTFPYDTALYAEADNISVDSFYKKFGFLQVCRVPHIMEIKEMCVLYIRNTKNNQRIL